MAKPEAGQLYVDLAIPDQHRTPLTYIGESSTRYVFEKQSDEAIYTVLKSRYAADVVDYVEPLKPLDPGTRWARTRNDYSGQIAEVLGRPFSYNGKDWVTYAVIVNSNNDTPQVRTEKDFRRIFGRPIPRSGETE